MNFKHEFTMNFINKLGRNARRIERRIGRDELRHKPTLNYKELPMLLTSTNII
jgi:hypothetical protein